MCTAMVDQGGLCVSWAVRGVFMCPGRSGFFVCVVDRDLFEDAAPMTTVSEPTHSR